VLDVAADQEALDQRRKPVEFQHGVLQVRRLAAFGDQQACLQWLAGPDRHLDDGTQGAQPGDALGMANTFSGPRRA